MYYAIFCYVLFLDGDPNLGNQSVNSNKSSGASSAVGSLNSSSGVSEEVLATMDTLMQSLTSGDFSSVDPTQFYSLLDTLQGLDGLNHSDIQQLEHSYSQYLKVAASLGSSGLNSLNSNSGGMSIPSNVRATSMNQSMSPHISPRMSPSNSPLSHSPLSHSPQLIDSSFTNHLGSGPMQMGLLVSNPYVSPSMSPNHSPVGSPVMRHALLNSGSTSSNGSHLSPNRMRGNAPSQSYQNQIPGFSGSPIATDRQFMQDSTTEQQYLQSAAQSNLMIEDEDDEFDWSSIL